MKKGTTNAFYCFSVFVFFSLTGCLRQDSWQTIPGQHPQSFEKAITTTVKMQFLLFLPQEYGKTDKKWPLILFLHGSGERGTDLELVKKHGPPKLVENQPDFPFIVVSPQLPKGSGWSPDGLNALLDELLARVSADPDRIYLTGLSMGGYGTWALASQYPERFAAIAPICGGGDTDLACNLKNVPVWAFHGAKDDVVSLKEAEEMVNAVKACGGNVRFTVYPEAGHDSWTETYANPELYQWFLSHRKK
jgi:predicted peptidase